LDNELASFLKRSIVKAGNSALGICRGDIYLQYHIFNWLLYRAGLSFVFHPSNILDRCGGGWSFTLNINIMKIKRLLHFILITIMSIAFSCTFNEKSKGITNKNSLVGTWKLVEYSDYDTLSRKWKNPYGEHPKGYFTYTGSGIVSINASAERPLDISIDSIYTKSVTLGAILDNAFGYFGTYSIDSVQSVVTHHVVGGSVIDYIGTDQHRQFILKGDTLFIGDPTFTVGKRVLVREK
jgi:hypothetical protein